VSEWRGARSGGYDADRVTIVDGLVTIVANRDIDTGHHLNAVGLLAGRLATHLGFDVDMIERCAIAGRLHDVGKQMIDLSILLKPASLSVDEWTEMRRHAEFGAHMVGAFRPLHEFVDIVRHHHERVDGRGYPHGLMGEEIPIEARVIAVVDAFHAMTIARRYTGIRTPPAALEEIRRCAGTQFDEEIAGAFLDMMGARSVHIVPRSESA
jgi:putative nucleotidyltransferase with HDIG domain